MKEYNKQKEVLSTSIDSTVPSKTGGKDRTGSTKVILVKNLGAWLVFTDYGDGFFRKDRNVITKFTVNYAVKQITVKKPYLRWVWKSAISVTVKP
jgi:hypothetical protein